jgi:hypothetical protein
MHRIRVRKDGKRELKADDEVHEIPHDHELVPNPTFATAYREAFLVNPLYMSVSRSDIACADAFVALAAAQDLIVMSERLTVVICGHSAFIPVLSTTTFHSVTC